MDPSKDTLSEHLDDVKHADDDGERPANAMTMPPSLAALSEREYKKLGRWATAKMTGVAAMSAVALRRYPLSWPDSPGDNLGVSMSFPEISRLSAAETKGS